MYLVFHFHIATCICIYLVFHFHIVILSLKHVHQILNVQPLIVNTLSYNEMTIPVCYMRILLQQKSYFSTSKVNNTVNNTGRNERH